MAIGPGKRVKTPTVLQLEAVECGAASLAMILGYHGRIEPLAKLRQNCGVSRDGSKAANILRAARRYGLEANGIKASVDALRNLQMPCILFWEFNHFVVLEGFKKDRVYINDPAMGHRIISISDFERSFTGVALAMQPGEQFEKGGKRPSLIGAVAERLAGSALPVVFCIFVGFLMVIPGILFPVLLQVFLDEIILQGRVDWARPVMLGMFSAILLGLALRYLQMNSLRRLRLNLTIKLSSQFLWHLLQLPNEFYVQRFAGEVASRSRLNEELASDISGRLAQTAIDVVMAGLYLTVMLYYDVLLTCVGLCVALLNFTLLRWISASRIEASMRVLQEFGKAEGTAMAGLKGMETIKASGLESGFYEKWSGYYSKAINAQQNLQVSNVLLSTMPTLLSALATVLVIIVGGFRVIDGFMTIGMLVAFQSLMGSFLGPVENLLDLGTVSQEMRGDLDRIDDVLKYPFERAALEMADSDEQEGEKVFLSGDIRLENVSFGYNPLEPPMLEDMNMHIKPGDRVALVGGSGSGKSTLAKLISGELVPWSGEIYFDGVPLSELPRNQFVNSFSFISQEILLFSGTVRDNLTLWDSTVPDSDLHQACEDAAILETITALPGGFDAELIEGGNNLSGGQRQRLEIARTLVPNPTILILDEATSALDTETERVVLDRMRMRGCSSIFVSHRLSTIRDCTEIIVLEHGKVVERGNHDQLWSAAGAYANLLKLDDEFKETSA
ncbi:MAG TPA: NHLP family bacteriocin export ABC transporter peptidase/permease/ATPase subunit [Planctomycetes bacterium]|nr:NHLP family bacteriocin export ABC transporter peptidase/permease/ATPase subunit [Planctomycetota bacterium]HIK82124.1 NHLP family bacteriocin export ABC transporter peptidase/permease/ATPase subunit [Planctomycetota bacterium]